MQPSRLDIASSAQKDESQFVVINELQLDSTSELTTLRAGLLASRASLSPKYFYDELGCALYEAITRLPEYYPTRTEMRIFEAHRHAIAHAIGRGKQFIDLGSGDSLKAMSWFNALQPTHYVAVDIAESAIRQSLTRIRRERSEMELSGLVTDFSRVLNLAAVLKEGARTFFYPGSSIGNFTPDEAVHFLHQVKLQCPANTDGLLIGADCKKDTQRLDLAYDDPLGVTAAFNLNALRHVNRLLSANFDVKKWKHRGFYNDNLGRIEMHLEALCEQTVTLGETARHFVQGEQIHSENSYKYAPHEFTVLLKQAGFTEVELWQDIQGDFAVYYAK